MSGPLTIVLNEYADKGARFTPFLLGYEAWKRGRDVRVVRLGDVSIRSGRSGGRIIATAATVPPLAPAGGAAPVTVEDVRDWVAALHDPRWRRREVDLTAGGADGLVLLRNTPASQERHGFRGDNPGVLLGRLLEERGVRVVNRAASLPLGGSKAWLATLPADCVPQTLIARDVEQLRDFVSALDGPAVLKPAVGFGGDEVFLVRRESRDTLPTIVEVIRRHGYVCAQEYVRAAESGDLRVLVVGGAVPRAGGQPAVYRRVHGEGDFRNNVHSGARAETPEWGEREERLLRTVGARLHAEGLDFVGLDVAGGRVLDVNVYNPGGLRLMSQVHGVDFAPAVLDALDRLAGSAASDSGAA